MAKDTVVKKEIVHYNRIFPSVISTTSFMQLYFLFLFEKKDAYYGKELIDEVEKRFGDKWRPSHGMVYPMLRDLEKKGLLKADWEDADKKTKRIYIITPYGKTILREELKDKENMFIDSYNMIAKIMGDLYNKNKPRILNVK